MLVVFLVCRAAVVWRCVRSVSAGIRRTQFRRDKTDPPVAEVGSWSGIDLGLFGMRDGVSRRRAIGSWNSASANRPPWPRASVVTATLVQARGNRRSTGSGLRTSVMR